MSQLDFKLGDRVKQLRACSGTEAGKIYILKYGNSVGKEIDQLFAWDSTTHNNNNDDKGCFCPDNWEKVNEREEITFENCEVGDVIDARDGDKKKVLGIKKILILSHTKYGISIQDKVVEGWTKEKFESHHFSFIQPNTKPEEMTMEQVCKALGKTIKIIK